MINDVFYSEWLKSKVRQIDKRTARKKFEKNVEVYLQPCCTRFDNKALHPVVIGKNNFDCQGYSFDRIVSDNKSYNCDNIRGAYLHFFIKVTD